MGKLWTINTLPATLSYVSEQKKGPGCLSMVMSAGEESGQVEMELTSTPIIYEALHICSFSSIPMKTCEV